MKCPVCERIETAKTDYDPRGRGTDYYSCSSCGARWHVYDGVTYTEPSRTQPSSAAPSTVQFKPTQKWRNMMRAQSQPPTHLDLSTPDAITGTERGFRNVLQEWVAQPLSPFRQAAMDGVITALFDAIRAQAPSVRPVPPAAGNLTPTDLLVHVVTELEYIAKELRGGKMEVMEFKREISYHETRVIVAVGPVVK